jgi:hypothetical protein
VRSLTDAERALLTADSVEVTAGCDLLDTSNAFVADISDDLTGGEVARDNYASVHGSCRLGLLRALAWGRDRVRPWMRLSRVTGYEDVTRTWTEPDQVLAETVNLATVRDPVTLGSSTLTTGVTYQGRTWTRLTVNTAHHGARLNVDEADLMDGETYTTSWLVANDGTASVTVAVDWCDGGEKYLTVAPGEVWRLSTNPSARADYTSTFRFTDLRITTAGDSILFADISVFHGTDASFYFDGDTPDTATYDYAWTGTAHASTSLRRTMQRGQEVTETTREPVVDEARFNLGVYVLTTPDTKRGEEPPTWDVQGYDLLHLLQDGPGDTYVATAGTTYLQAVRDVVTASGVGATLRLDGTGQDTTLPRDRVWALPVAASWLTIINDLLREIGYIGVYANAEGELRSRPFAAVDQAASEWTLDTADPATNIVGEERVVSEDVWGRPNWWRFVRQQLAYQPVEGDGLYTVQNADDGATSQNALGRTVRRLHYLDAPDQASLVAQGDRIVAEDRQVTRRIDLTIDPLPAMGHRDVFTLIDGGTTEKAVASGWTLPLDGSPGRLTLGGDQSRAPEPVEQQTTATVTQASGAVGGLRVVVDGATVGSAAVALDGATYAVDERVQTAVRNPQPPLVNGKEA